MAQGSGLATAGRASSNIGAEISESATAKHAAPSDHLLKQGNCHVVGDRSSLDILARAEQHNAANLSSAHNPGRGFHAEARIPQGSVVKDGGATYLSFGPDNGSETTTGRPTLKGVIQQIDRTDRTPTGAESLPGSLPAEKSGGESKIVQPTRAQYGGEVPSIPMIKPELSKTAEPPKESQDSKTPIDVHTELNSTAWLEWNKVARSSIHRSIQTEALFSKCNLKQLGDTVEADYTFDVDKHGHVSNVVLLKPSGDASYDKASAAGIRNANLPAFPEKSEITSRTIPIKCGPKVETSVPNQIEEDGILKTKTP